MECPRLRAGFFIMCAEVTDLALGVSRPRLIGLWLAENLLCNKTENQLLANWNDPVNQRLAKQSLYVIFLGVAHPSVCQHCLQTRLISRAPS